MWFVYQLVSYSIHKHLIEDFERRFIVRKEISKRHEDIQAHNGHQF